MNRGRMFTRTTPLFALLMTTVGLAGCGEEAKTEQAAVFGRALLANPKLSGSQFNAFACTTCHKLEAEPASPGITAGQALMAGHTLANVTFRPRFFGGNEASLLGAVNFCYVHFMKGIMPLEADDPLAKAIYEALVELSPERPSAALPWTVVRTAAPLGEPAGDPAKGRVVYDAACASCHGDAQTGMGRLMVTPAIPILREVIPTYAQLFAGVAPSLVVIEKVRHGQFFGVGGNMPPFATERLSDADLANLLAFLGI